jgi:hypothetical protein
MPFCELNWPNCGCAWRLFPLRGDPRLPTNRTHIINGGELHVNRFPRRRNLSNVLVVITSGNSAILIGIDSAIRLTNVLSRTDGPQFSNLDRN